MIHDVKQNLLHSQITGPDVPKSQSIEPLEVVGVQTPDVCTRPISHRLPVPKQFLHRIRRPGLVTRYLFLFDPMPNPELLGTNHMRRNRPDRLESNQWRLNLSIEKIWVR